ncbi:MAG: pitrilysin family protein [Bacteroidota bacterium]|nr:pitrilysin family protein [Bacteroidota bacterium]
MNTSTTYKKTELDRGIRIVSETIPYVRSVSIGVWINVGSRDEKSEVNGISHFVEHMVFKGTKKYNTKQIAKSIEEYGGYLNAFTSKENTCYYGKVLDEHVEKTVDVLSELVLNPTLNPKDIEKEKTVVLEELKNIEDDPEDYIHDYLDKTIFGKHPLGYSVIGEAKNIRSFTKNQLLKYIRNYYSPGRIVISAAGNISHEKLVDLVQSRFENNRRKNNNHLERSFKPVKAYRKIIEEAKPIRQSHICMGTVTGGIKSKNRYPLVVMNTLLGGGMSSRLFQTIREKYGYAYSVSSFLNMLSDCGCLGVYAGTSKKNIQKTIELINNELKKLRILALNKTELNRTKAQVKGSMMLSLESMSSRMMRLASGEIYFNEYTTLDSIVKRIDAVTIDDILEVANKYLYPENFSVVIFKPSE